jgi:hypothetical protein
MKRSASVIGLTVNGMRHELAVEPRRLLVDCLRDDLGLTGTHIGCEHGVCGTCTVLVNDETVRSCLMLAVQADGASIATVEGLATDGTLHPLQQAFRDAQGLQCGFYAGHADAGVGAAARQRRAHGGGDPRGDLGEPLSLHGVPGDRRGGPARGRARAQWPGIPPTAR